MTLLSIKMNALLKGLAHRYFLGSLALTSLIMTGLSSVISPVFAEAASSVSNAATSGASTSGPSSALTQGLLLGAFILIFYFFIIRPQSKRAKQQRDLIGGLQKGDEVLTNGGLIGKITKITDSFFVVMIAEETEVLVQKQAITASLPKGTMKSI